ncbi:Endonuclease G, mitochondrial [Armadillidium nasatum]|uniref:Endonuclease n=1 Tax=Armadillidium nasatum TaxID=96803 RepID=A0A5N5SL59_9CRUS|nr:Endonuclease G, mitochondrial [Armadillidium nasatum]
MNRFRKIVHVATLATGASIGWFCAKINYTENKNSSFNLSPLPALPLFGTVSAGEPKGLALPSDLQEIVPEPAPNAPRIAQIMRFGFPSLNNVRSMNDFVLSYDTRNRVPFWVFEHLSSSTLIKDNTVDRSKCDFHEDTSIHEYFRSHNVDYKGSGFDRGHMAAAGNHKRCHKDCEETFLLSNMAPQVGKGFNRDKWNDIEKYCRKLPDKFKNVYVCTGPLYLPRLLYMLENDGKLYVKYQVIGKNHVAVPTHFFKVVVCESESGNLELESFLLPNKSIDDATPIETFHVDPEVIERASGLLFFDRITRKNLSKINRKSIGWF